MKRLGRSLFYCAKMKCFKRFFNWLSKKNRKTFIKEGDAVLNVLKVGIEPTLPKKLDFESSASTNSAT